MERITLITKPVAGYELLDSGKEEKLERFGDQILVRPDPQALWEKRLATSDWEKANGTYVREGKDGKWVGKLPAEWTIEYRGLNFIIRPTSFKHTGLFPEQFGNWEWTRQLLENNKGLNVLNLFGYTGGATIAAAAAGAQVTHVDASKTAVAWARDNTKASGLEEAPIKWIVEDALTFVKREVKRGNKYEGIIMDPPAFGHGPSGELWKIEENLLELIKLTQELLSDNAKFFLINGYAAGYSSLAFAYNLEPLVAKLGGTLEHGDLTIQHSNDERLLPAGIFARWSR